MAVIAFSASLTACGESNNEESDKQTVTEETTKERGTISNEQIEALKSGDEAKANELSEKLDSMVDSINQMNPGPEQQKPIEEINKKVTKQLYQSAQAEVSSEESSDEK